MKISKLFPLCFLVLGFVLSNSLLHPRSLSAEELEELELESLMESQTENIQEEVRQDIKTSIKQESYEVAAENIIEPSVAASGTHACQASAGTWVISTNETYCDGSADSGTHTITVDANCTFLAIVGPNQQPLLGKISGTTITFKASFNDTACNGGNSVTMTGSGTVTGNSVSGNYVYSTNAGHTGTFSGTKQ